MKELRVTYLKKFSLSLWVVMRERECRECFLLPFFYLLQYVFFFK